MAGAMRSEPTTSSRVTVDHRDRVEPAANGEHQVRSQRLQLLGADLEQVTAAGGGVRIGSDGANN